MRQPAKWWIGLPVVAGLVFVAANTLQPAVEDDLAARVGARVNGSSALDQPQIVVRGRDVTVSGVALSPEEKDNLLSQARRADGVRALADATSVLGRVSPFVLKLERKGAVVTMSGAAPIGGARQALRAGIRLLGMEIVDETAFATGAPANFLDLAQFAVGRVAELDPGKVTLADSSFDIAGVARGDAEFDAAVAARSAIPAGGAVARFEVSAPRVSPYVFSVAANHGLVTLSGHIPSSELRAVLLEKATAAAAGRAVSDAMRVGSGAPQGDFSAAAAAAIAALGKLDEGKATLSDAKLTVDGQGRANVDAAGVMAAVKAQLPRGFDLGAVDVSAGAVSPYVFEATSDGAGVKLSGYAPDDAARAQILDAARKVFPEARVSADLKVAKGAPRQFLETVVASMRSLARLSNGRLTFSGAAATLEGAAPYEKAAPDIEARFAAALPQGFGSATRLSAHTLGARLDAARCKAGFAEILAKSEIAFAPDDASIADGAAPALDALAALALRCDDMVIEVVAHTDAEGIDEVNRAVAKRRAQLIVDHLVKAGADAFKITAVSMGAQQPTAPGAAAENRAKNSRIEFVVKEIAKRME